MVKDNDEKPMTIKDFQEVIIPAMEGVFATKKDLAFLHTELQSFKTEAMEKFATKQELAVFRNESFNFFDKIIKDLDILMTEQKMGYYQKQKERSLWTIMIEAMKEHQILSVEQVQKIKELGVF